LNEVPVGVAICAKFEQPPPWQRSTLYPVTPTLSVEALQDRLICVVEAAVAAKLVGAVGGAVSVELFPDPLAHPARKPTAIKMVFATAAARTFFLVYP